MVWGIQLDMHNLQCWKKAYIENLIATIGALHLPGYMHTIGAAGTLRIVVFVK